MEIPPPTLAPLPPLAESAELTLTLGRALFRFGASTQRIIDSMEFLYERLGGSGQLEVLVTYDAITVTALRDAQSCTRVDASREVTGINIHALGEIRRLLLDTEDFEPSLFRARLARIIDHAALPPFHPARWLAAGAVAAGFGAFNGGDGGAVITAFVAAQAIFAVRTTLLRRRFSGYLATLGAVCAGGAVAGLAARLGWSSTPGVALVAPALFLFPGAPLITGGIDITRNHNSVGLARIVHAFALIATIFLGLALSLPLFIDLPTHQRAVPPPSWSVAALDVTWGLIAAAGLALLNNGRTSAIVICALCGGTARLVHELGLKCGFAPAGATLVAAVAATLFAIRLGERARRPSVILAVLACLTMIPGFLAIAGLRGLFEISQHGIEMPWSEAAFGAQMMLQAAFISFAIVVGIIFTIMAVERDTRRV